MIITRTPYRISFFGGGTDYPCWYEKYGGAVLATAIDKYCWIAVRPPTRFGPRFKVVYSKVEECDRLEDVQHPAVRECLRHCGYAHDGCEVHHWADLPARSGMGSSSAFVVGLLHALQVLKGGGVTSCYGRRNLPETAVFIERDVLKETVGDQDQNLCAFGNFTLLEFRYGIAPEPYLVDHGLPCQSLLQNYLLLYYTGIQRTASDVAATYINDFEQHKSELLSLAAMARSAKNLVRGCNWPAFGNMLHEAWELKKSLGPAVSTPRVDTLYEKGRRAGAWGGKLLGAGGGGFLLLCCPPAVRSMVQRAMADEGLPEVPVRFDREGTCAQRILF